MSHIIDLSPSKKPTYNLKSNYFFSSRTSANTMPRAENNHRHRAITLLPGSPFHEAFFGQDETFRDSFDQERAVAEFCTPKTIKRRQRRHDSSPSMAKRRSRKLTEYGFVNLLGLFLDAYSASGAGGEMCSRPPPVSAISGLEILPKVWSANRVRCPLILFSPSLPPLISRVS